jgi:hypothetical protein
LILTAKSLNTRTYQICPFDTLKTERYVRQ